MFDIIFSSSDIHLIHTVPSILFIVLQFGWFSFTSAACLLLQIALSPIVSSCYYSCWGGYFSNAHPSSRGSRVGTLALLFLLPLPPCPFLLLCIPCQSHPSPVIIFCIYLSSFTFYSFAATSSSLLARYSFPTTHLS